jgi:PAS domain S-box-containing protein
MSDNLFNKGLVDTLSLWGQSIAAPETLRAALLLALFGAVMVIGLFFYLNYWTRKSYFNLWTVAWMLYAVWLAVSLQLQETPDQTFLIMVRRACIGISALFMFWGSLRFAYGDCRLRELGMAVVMIVLWSYVGAYQVGDKLWITVPMFLLLGAASAYTGSCFLRLRGGFRGASILGTGFILWGVHLLGFPFESELSGAVMAIGYFGSAMLALFIAMGMLILVLERARERNDTLVGQFRKGAQKRRLLEQEITHADQKYRALFDAATDAILLVDLETLEIVEVNRAAQDLVQRNMVDIVGRSFADFCPSIARDGETPLENKRQFDQLFQPSVEFGIVRANGSHVSCEGRSSLIRNNGRPVLQVNIREITQRKAIEQQLRQAEKLSALGQLIAGVAHELNNPLAVIMGYAQLFSKQTASDATVQAGLQKILHESERASKIVRNLLTFARPREPQMTVVHVNDLVTSVLDTRDRDVREHQIDLNRNLTVELPFTKADPTQIEQVLNNLVTNAVQAMAGTAGPRRLDVRTEQREQFIRITVADNGPGIPAHVLGRIFDPFFTTKAPGKGTGLGLSLCYNIVEEHRGKIWVQSEVGHGTRFFVELPIVACEQSLGREATNAGNSRRDPQAAARRLLVVDDEPGVVEVLSEVLGANGYVVETALDGASALERIESEHFDLIISDLCMPQMDGQRLYKTIRDKYPHMAKRVVFVTGDIVSSNSRAFLEWTGNRWLTKPFNLGEVEEIVHNFLCGGSPAPVLAAK